MGAAMDARLNNGRQFFFDVEQGSETWHKLRAGVPTASEFKTLLGINKEAKDKVTRRNYMLKLAGEIISGEPMESYQNAAMDRGKVMEAEARSWYAFMTDEPLQQVGFVRFEGVGASPDSLVGDAGLLEIKTAQPNVLIDLLLKDEFPPAHMAQCQGNLWVAEREWLDIVVYWPSVPKLSKRLYRDETYIKSLSIAVDAFNSELAEIVARIKARAA